MSKKKRNKPPRRDLAQASVAAQVEGPRTVPGILRNPVGRPTDYLPTYPEALRTHMAGGLSFESFAGVVGCALATIYNWAKEHPEFLDAKKAGEVACRLWWEEAGRNALNAKVFNSTVWIFNMKNRFRWCDRSEVSGPDGGPIEVKSTAPLTDEEKARMAELQAKLKELEAAS